MYQLTDHLGNVRAVIAKDALGAMAISSTADYYPGGMAMRKGNLKGEYHQHYNFSGHPKGYFDSRTLKPPFRSDVFPLNLFLEQLNSNNIYKNLFNFRVIEGGIKSPRNFKTIISI